MINPLTMLVGTTIIPIKLNSEPGKPATSIATRRNNVPLIMVPATVNRTALNAFTLTFLTNMNRAKKIKAVIGFSTIFAICPPAMPVVSAEITPAAILAINTFCFVGASMMAKNIITSRRSGFMPKNNGGTIV